MKFPLFHCALITTIYFITDYKVLTSGWGVSYAPSTYAAVTLIYTYILNLSYNYV